MTNSIIYLHYIVLKRTEQLIQFYFKLNNNQKFKIVRVTVSCLHQESKIMKGYPL